MKYQIIRTVYTVDRSTYIPTSKIIEKKIVGKAKTVKAALDIAEENKKAITRIDGAEYMWEVEKI